MSREYDFQHVVSLDLGSSFQERFDSLRAGSYRIAYYYDYPDETTFRYRVYNMIEVLRLANDVVARRGVISASWFCYRDAGKLHLVVDNCDAIVFVRARYSAVVADTMSRANFRGRKIFYDIDDLVVDVDLIPLIMSTLDENNNDARSWEYWFQYISRLYAVLSRSDCIITTGTELADYVRSMCDKPVYIVPNFFNSHQEQISKPIRDKKLSGSLTNTGEIYIGYFSGTNTHNRDFEIAAPALIRCLKKYKNLRLVVGGLLDLDKSFSSMSDRIDRLDMMNFGPLQVVMNNIDFNIAPLQDNIFTKCKSELKFFEPGLVATPTVASNVGSLARSIVDNQNGWLAGSHEWLLKLEQAIEFRLSSFSDYDRISRASFMSSYEIYHYKKMIKRVAEIFNL